MKIVDILIQNTAYPAGFTAGQFTVNNAVNYVPLVYTGTASQHILTTGYYEKLFDIADNFEVVSLGFSIPSGFSMWEQFAKFDMMYKSNGAEVYFPGLERLCVPFENYELPINSFYNVKDLNMDDKKIGVKILNPTGNNLNISMIGVPAALNGLVFPVSAFVKISHNKRLNIL